MKVDKNQLSFLNQLASEIVVLDKDLKIVWLNDSALNKGWALNSNNKDNLITDQFSEETNAKLVNLLKKVINKNGAKTKRDFELSTSANTKRIIDLTVSWSSDFECLILEILCVDNLNKIRESFLLDPMKPSHHNLYLANDILNNERLAIFNDTQKNFLSMHYFVSRVLQKSLPNDVRVLTKKEFIDFEKNYWRNSTAIGFIFTLGAFMGFVVGCVVVYQILYSDVTDHLPEYATLLAMGYRLKSLFFVVAREGFILAFFGYLPAYFSGQLLYALVRNSTRLPIEMDASKSILIFILILFMCMGSAGIAMRKLVDADPAEIF